MLASGFPMCVRWGPQFVMIYNDGYRSILGNKHPTAFGLPFHEAWPEVQPQLRPLHEAILNGTSGAFSPRTFSSKFSARVRPIGKMAASRSATARSRMKAPPAVWPAFS